jgi:DNA primase large subunit
MKDERFNYMLIELSKHISIDFNLCETKRWSEQDKISLADLDLYSRFSFPPCMKASLTALRNNHYLQYNGRA